MTKTKIKRALISVYDKTGIVDFARALVDEFGIEIISTGGTADLLKKNDIPVTLVEDVTGSPEMMDGRVKTLHPKIHAAILADRDNPDHMRQLADQDIKPIDMVVVNLYSFEEEIAKPDCSFAQAIEMIDIGGPCLLRAAAKNHKHVLVVDNSAAYSETLDAFRNYGLELAMHDELRIRYAASAFAVTTCYDGDIAKWLGSHDTLSAWPSFRQIPMYDWGEFCYGENPHQKGHLLELIEEERRDDEELEANLAVADAQSGKDEQKRMSFNNYADAHAALELCKELARGVPLNTVGLSGDVGPTLQAAGNQICVFIKHTNACGTGIADDPIEAYRRAYLGDPNAAMGGILACSFAVDHVFAEAVMDTYARWGKAAGVGGFFAEVWIAVDFDEKAVEIIRTKKNWGQRVRLLSVSDMTAQPTADELEYKSISGGMLMQNRDLVGLNEAQWNIVTKRKPSDTELTDLRLAWLICKHTKSNAITLCKDHMLIGNGAGQMSRVMSCRIATWLAKENGHEAPLAGAVAASDAFFPFRDGPEILIDAGITAIIQPGGSKRDEETIQACNERNVAMIFTGTRHFKH